jgi:hypothetical protein
MQFSTVTSYQTQRKGSILMSYASDNMIAGLIVDARNGPHGDGSLEEGQWVLRKRYSTLPAPMRNFAYPQPQQQPTAAQSVNKIF